MVALQLQLHGLSDPELCCVSVGQVPERTGARLTLLCSWRGSTCDVAAARLHACRQSGHVNPVEVLQ